MRLVVARVHAQCEPDTLEIPEAADPSRLLACPCCGRTQNDEGTGHRRDVLQPSTVISRLHMVVRLHSLHTQKGPTNTVLVPRELDYYSL